MLVAVPIMLITHSPGELNLLIGRFRQSLISVGERQHGFKIDEVSSRRKIVLNHRIECEHPISCAHPTLDCEITEIFGTKQQLWLLVVLGLSKKRHEGRNDTVQ